MLMVIIRRDLSKRVVSKCMQVDFYHTNLLKPFVKI